MPVQWSYPKIFIKMLEDSFLWIYQLEGDIQNLQFINGHFMTISGHFFVNYMNIFHKTEISTVILRCLTYLNLNWIKSYNIKYKFSHFWFFCKLTELTKTDEYMKLYFSAFSWIFLDRIIVQAPSMCHFKCLGMRNLENDIKICQNTIY